MFKPQKTPELAQSLDVVQTIARFLPGPIRHNASISEAKESIIKKVAAAGKNRMVINGFMNHQI